MRIDTNPAGPPPAQERAAVLEQRRNAARILVVDDEPTIVEMLAMSLRFHGYEVVGAADGGEALTAVARSRPHLIILDVVLPDILGFDLLPQLRQESSAPVLFLTARDAVEDRVFALTHGAEDYVTKPFSLEELIARVAVILRRTGSLPAGPLLAGSLPAGSLPAGDAPDAEMLRYADLAMDEQGHEVWRREVPIRLSPTEFALLRYLLRNAGRVMSRAQILEHVWRYDFDGDASVVDSYVRYLRRKIDVFDPPLIETVRGVGYTLRLPRQLRTPPPQVPRSGVRTL